jgi:prefoldin subunit 5
MSPSQTDPVHPPQASHLGILPDALISDIADHRSGHDGSAQSDPPGTEVQWVNTELHTIASTIEQLQSRLEEASSRLETVSKVETAEVEIGRLFVEAQRFCDDSLSKLEVKVHEILIEAEAKANQMLAEAHEDAQEIRRQAQQAAFTSTRTVQDLQSAISGFTKVNADLLTELGTLNSMLLPAVEREPIGEDHHAGPTSLTERD